MFLSNFFNCIHVQYYMCVSVCLCLCGYVYLNMCGYVCVNVCFCMGYICFDMYVQCGVHVYEKKGL